MAVLRVQPSARAACMLSCLLLVCLTVLGQGRWQHSFLQASTPVQRSTGTFCSNFTPRLPGRHLPQGAQPSVRGSCLLWLPCLALLGTVTHRRGVACFVRERKGGGRSKGNKGDNARAARILTSKIKEAGTAAELLGVLDAAVDSSIFNDIHVSAACTSLAAFHAKGQLPKVDAKSPVIQRLASRIGALVKASEVGPRQLANVLWAFAKMFVAVPAVLVIMPALAGAVAAKAKGMNAQELANSLWAAAQLQDECPEKRQIRQVVRALVAQIPGKAGDMIPQALSNILLAAAKLQDVAPVVREALPAIAAEIRGKAGDMKPQHLSNSLWAAAKLRNAAPELLQIARALVAQIPYQAGQIDPQGISNCLFAAMRLADAVPEVVDVVAVLVKEVPGKIGSMTPQGLANSLEALVVLEKSRPIPELLPIATAAAAWLKQILPELAELQDNDKDLLFAVPVVVWACATKGVLDERLLGAVARGFASDESISSLPDWGVCALAWTYRRLDDQKDVGGFLKRLESEISKRGLQEEEVLATRV